jgi:tellurite resistance protein TerC
VEAVVYVFGVLLLYVAYRAFRGAAEQSDPSANPVLRLVRRTVPVTDDFRGGRLIVREGGRRYGTPLLLVVVAIMVADIAFAVDSIPAAFAVTHDPVVIWTANAFALLGLGSLLVLVELLVRRLRYLDETIALILGFVGIKILAADLVHISDLGSLAVIVAPLQEASSRRLLRIVSIRLTWRRRRRDVRPAAPKNSHPRQLRRADMHRNRPTRHTLTATGRQAD